LLAPERVAQRIASILANDEEADEVLLS
jgi:hypothetical protein